MRRSAKLWIARMVPRNLARALAGAMARLFKEQHGASATVVAIALPGLLGFAALGAETGVWFTIKLQNQSAADAAALAAAYGVIAGDGNDQLVAAAEEAAARNGYRGRLPIITYPYSDAAFSDAIAVTLSQSEGALLAAPFIPGVTLMTKAVATVAVFGNPCLLALGTAVAGITVEDAGHLAAPDCPAVANSISRNAIGLRSGTSSITAATLFTAGQLSLAGDPIDPAAAPPQLTLAALARVGAPPVADPYSGTLTHAFLVAGMPGAGTCKAKNTDHVRIYEGDCVVAGTALTRSRIGLSPGTQVTGPWTIVGGQSVDLAPGTYWVTGGDLTIQAGGVLKCSSCDNVSGLGVTIIMTVGADKVGTVTSVADASLALNAPRAGRFAGLVVVQDSNGLPEGSTYTSRYSTIQASPGATLNGLVYFPNSTLTFTGNPAATGPECLLLVVDSAIIEGASGLSTSGCASGGLAPLPKVFDAVLIE